MFKAFCYGEWGDVDNSVKECMIQQQIKNMHKEKMPWLSSEALGLCTFTAKVSLILNQGTKILQSTPNKGEKCVCVCLYIDTHINQNKNLHGKSLTSGIRETRTPSSALFF